MIIYFDTSSLVKLYIDEDSSEVVSGLLESCDIAATSIIAYAETRAAFARRCRDKVLSPVEYRNIVTDFNSDWSDFVIINTSNDLILQAGEMAERYALRGFDSIHLSSAMTLKNKTQSEISFSCFDSKLNFAAKQLLLNLV